MITKLSKPLSALLAAAALAIAAAGCVSNKAISGIHPHSLKVVDAVTKLPVSGAHVTLSAPGMIMGHTTDQRGVVDIGAYGFYSMPKPEQVEVTMQGYDRVSFRLTNGLPHTVELTPAQSHN